MPELPEVEVVKRSLVNTINNFIIKSIRINDENLRYKVKKREIIKIIGSKIIQIKRRSKYLLFFFSKGFVMIVHLGMTGKFFIIDNKKKKQKTSFYYNLDYKKDEKYNRIVFYFKNKTKLIYNDVRKFGFVKIDNIKKIKKNIHLKQIGPEPLENSFSFSYFKNFVKKRKIPVKNLLMSQNFVAGLGNIYSNEILFVSRVNPIKISNKLGDNEIKKIIENTKKILKKAIKFGGSSIRNFSSSSGKDGNYQDLFKVYGRKGQLCSNTDCKGIIKRIKQCNRSSFFCPICQK